jgi:hypothetical protein
MLSRYYLKDSTVYLSLCHILSNLVVCVQGMHGLNLVQDIDYPNLACLWFLSVFLCEHAVIVHYVTARPISNSHAY